MERLRIMLAVPGNQLTFGSALGILFSSQDHDIDLANSRGTWDNMLNLLVSALNARRENKTDMLAMLHQDVAPDKWWIDTLVKEKETKGVSFISVMNAMKDIRGLLSCGVGNPFNDPWMGLDFRFTAREVQTMPETFTAADIGYADRPIMHNNGCILFDLRDERFFSEFEDGSLKVCWDFPKKILPDETGKLYAQAISEDWWLSWMLYQIGIPTAITRKVRTHHGVGQEFPNDQAWGIWEHDQEAQLFRDMSQSLSAQRRQRLGLPPVAWS
jgi:hypothetical protein